MTEFEHELDQEMAEILDAEAAQKAEELVFKTQVAHERLAIVEAAHVYGLALPSALIELTEIAEEVDRDVWAELDVIDEKVEEDNALLDVVYCLFKAASVQSITQAVGWKDDDWAIDARDKAVAAILRSEFIEIEDKGKYIDFINEYLQECVTPFVLPSPIRSNLQAAVEADYLEEADDALYLEEKNKQLSKSIRLHHEELLRGLVGEFDDIRQFSGNLSLAGFAASSEAHYHPPSGEAEMDMYISRGMISFKVLDTADKLGISVETIFEIVKRTAQVYQENYNYSID